MVSHQGFDIIPAQLSLGFDEMCFKTSHITVYLTMTPEVLVVEWTLCLCRADASLLVSNVQLLNAAWCCQSSDSRCGLNGYFRSLDFQWHSQKLCCRLQFSGPMCITGFARRICKCVRSSSSTLKPLCFDFLHRQICLVPDSKFLQYFSLDCPIVTICRMSSTKLFWKSCENMSSE